MDFCVSFARLAWRHFIATIDYFVDFSTSQQMEVKSMSIFIVIVGCFA